MSRKEKMGWEEKSYYIALAIGVIMAVWCAVDFESLAAVVNAPLTFTIAQIIVIGGFLIFMIVMAIPLIRKIIELHKKNEPRNHLKKRP